MILIWRCQGWETLARALAMKKHLGLKIAWVESMGSKRIKELKWWDCWTPTKKEKQMTWKTKWGQCPSKRWSFFMQFLTPVSLMLETRNLLTFLKGHRMNLQGSIGQEGFFFLLMLIINFFCRCCCSIHVAKCSKHWNLDFLFHKLIFFKSLFQPFKERLKTNQMQTGWGYGSVVQHSPSVPKAPGVMYSITEQMQK